MHVLLQRLRELILVCMEDFSNEHSPASVSCCGAVCFDLEETGRDSGIGTSPVGLPPDRASACSLICARGGLKV
jgi:hypothetical protein